MFSCNTSTGLLLNSGFFLAFYIVGFMALLSEVKYSVVFEQGYIGIAVGGLICSIYLACQI